MRRQLAIALLSLLPAATSAGVEAQEPAGGWFTGSGVPEVDPAWITSSVAPGYIVPEYVAATVRFVDGNEPIERK